MASAEVNLQRGTGHVVFDGDSTNQGPAAGYAGVEFYGDRKAVTHGEAVAVVACQNGDFTQTQSGTYSQNNALATTGSAAPAPSPSDTPAPNDCAPAAPSAPAPPAP
jgi:hypothetical protein